MERKNEVRGASVSAGDGGGRKNASVHPRGIFYNIFEFLRSRLLTKRSFDGIIKSQQNMMTRTGRPRGTNNLKGRLLSWVGSLQA